MFIGFYIDHIGFPIYKYYHTIYLKRQMEVGEICITGNLDDKGKDSCKFKFVYLELKCK